MLLEVTALFGALAPFYCLLKYVHHLLSLSRYPSGPFPLPVVGNMILLLRGVPFECLANLSEKYGDVFSVSMGTRRIVVVNSIQAAREALMTKGADFIGRVTEQYEASLTSRKFKGIIEADFTPEYQFSRNLGHKALQMYGDGFNSLEEKIRMEAEHMVERLKGSDEQPVTIRVVIGNAVLNVICSMLFGKRYDPTDSGFLTVVKYTGILASCSFRTDITSHLPWTRIFYETQNFKRFKEGVAIRDKFIRERFEEHKKDYNPDHVRDFCDFLFKTLQDKHYHWKVDSEDETRDHVEIILANMIISGGETSASVLSWAILYLLHWPHFQEQLFDEIIQVLGTEYLAWKDRSRLPLCQAFIQESLRMATILPLIPHKTTKPTTLCGKSIPKGTCVLFNYWAIHHDPRQWKNPEVFDPHRWLDAEGRCSSGHGRSYLPFGGGRRNCLAESMAKQELFVFLTRLIRSFEIRPNLEEPLLSIKDGLFGLTFAPRLYTAIFIPRNL